MKNKFEDLLESSAKAHGHLCSGQVVGVRMALLGLDLLGFEAPCNYEQIKRLIVYVEMDRCTADAVAHVCGVRLGRRSLKFVDYGIMAATFLDLKSGDAFRVLSTEESRDLAPLYAPTEAGPGARQLEAYRRMPNSVLFRVFRVKVDPSPFDLPGPTLRKETCSLCGQVVRDHKEVWVEGRPLCRLCAGGAYFENLGEIAASVPEKQPFGSSQGVMA